MGDSKDAATSGSSAATERIACPFSAYGCNAKLRKDEMAKHVDGKEQMFSHILQMMKTISQQNQVIAALSEALREAKQSLAEMSASKASSRTPSRIGRPSPRSPVASSSPSSRGYTFPEGSDEGERSGFIETDRELHGGSGLQKLDETDDEEGAGSEAGGLEVRGGVELAVSEGEEDDLGLERIDDLDPFPEASPHPPAYPAPRAVVTVDTNASDESIDRATPSPKGSKKAAASPPSSSIPQTAVAAVFHRASAILSLLTNATSLKGSPARSSAKKGQKQRLHTSGVEVIIRDTEDDLRDFLSLHRALQPTRGFSGKNSKNKNKNKDKDNKEDTKERRLAPEEGKGVGNGGQKEARAGAREGVEEKTKQKEDIVLSEIEAVYLSGQRFTTFDASVLWRLKALRHLDLSKNKLKEVGGSIESLVNLEVLNLSLNMLTSLPEGLEKLPKLQRLFVFQNKLINLPDQIGNLMSMKELQAHSNDLISIPPDVKRLKNLEVLGLRNNFLMTLPDEFADLSNLRSLDLSENKLCALPDEVQGLGKLEVLLLTKNSLIRIPSGVRGLVSLRRLDVRGNPLLRVFPPEMLALPALKDLRIDSVLESDPTVKSLAGNKDMCIVAA